MFHDNIGARRGQERMHVCCSIPESVRWDLLSVSARVLQQSQLGPHQPSAVAAAAGTACRQHEQWPECPDSCKAPGTCTRCISPLYATQNQACNLIMWWECIVVWMAGNLPECCGSKARSCMQSASIKLAQVVHTCTVAHLAAGPAVPILSTGHSMPIDASQTCIWPFSCAVRSCQSLRRREGAASILPVIGDCDPIDDWLLMSTFSSPCIELCCLVMATGPRTCTMGLSAFMALATPAKKHTESALPSLTMSSVCWVNTQQDNSFG